MEAQGKQEKSPKESQKGLAIFIFLCLALAFLPMFLPTTQCMGFEHDEGLFLVVASEIASGKTLYLDITDNKLPLLYYSLIPATYACGSNFMCYRAIAMCINFLIALILFAACSPHLKGIAKYMPSLAYLAFSIFGFNIFLRSELFLLLAWAIAFFALLKYVELQQDSMLLLFGFVLGAGVMVKPAAPVALALPFLYVLSGYKNKARILLLFFAGFFAALLLCALFFLPRISLAGLLNETSGWLPSDLQTGQSENIPIATASFNEIFPFYLSQLLLLVSLILLISLPILPLLFSSKHTKFEAVSLFFLLNTILLISSKTLSLSLHPGLLPLLFLPLSPPIGATFGRIFFDFKFPLSIFFLSIFLFFCLASFFTLSTQLPSREMLDFSTSHSECGWAHGAVSYLREHSNGTLFVFPSRAGYYFVLGKTPPTSVPYHHQVAFSLPKSDEWFEKNVFAPIRFATPGTILLFDEPFDSRSENGENFKYNEFRAFIVQNYLLAYSYNATGKNGATALVYEKR